MSKEQFSAFIQKLLDDSELKEKMEAAKSDEETIQIAKEYGFSIELSDIPELEDSELEEAAGGRGVMRGIARTARIGRDGAIATAIIGGQ